MNRILLLLENEKNRQMLCQKLGARNYTLLLPSQSDTENKENQENKKNKSKKAKNKRNYKISKISIITACSIINIQREFDIIIADRLGLEKHKEQLLKKKNSKISLPILLLLRQSEKILSHFRYLADDIIYNPINIEELIWRIENLLSRCRLSIETTDNQKSLLQQSEEHFRLLVEGVRDYAIFMLDNSGKVVSWNVGAERIMGYTAEEILGCHFSCFYPESDIICGKPKQELQLVDKAGQCEDEGIRIRKDGKQFWANMQLAALHDKRGERVGYSVIIHDLSARKQIEEELCKANRALRTICACNQAMIRCCEESELLQDICRIIVEIGKYRACWIGKIEAQENRLKLIAQSGISPLAGEQYDYLTPANILLAETAIRTGKPCTAINCNTIIALPLQNTSMSGKCEILGVLTIYAAESDGFDTSEIALLEELAFDIAYGIIALRAQQECHRALSALRESEERYRRLVELSPEGIIVHSQGIIVLINTAGAKLLGAESPQQIIGCRITNFLPSQCAEKQTVPFEEQKLLRLDKKEIKIEWAATPFTYRSQPAVLIVIRDLTERKRMEEALRRYRFQLEELVEARTRQLMVTNEKLQEEIRQRARIEAALRASEEQLRTLINATPDIICFKDGEGRWLEANQAVLELFQLEGIKYRGLKDSQLASLRSFYRDAFLTCEQTDEKAWQKGSLCRTEEVIPQPDGTVKIYDVIKVPLFYMNGARKGLVVLGRDITERKRAEKELVRLASIVEASDDAIIGTTLDGIIISWNSGAEKIYGYTAVEVKGQSSSILVPPERREELVQILERIKQGGRLEHYETVRLRKDGQKIDVAMTISPIQDAAGRIIGVSTITRDISDRHRIEAALERLRHQNELILNSAGEGICGLDETGKITFVNPAASRMFGYDLKELLNQPMHAFLHHSHSDKTPYPQEMCPIHASLQDGSIHHVTNEVFWRKDGSSFPVEYVSTPILEQDKIVGAVVTFKDITERLAVERMKDEFISIVSHELRTPLTSIRGAMGLLASGILKSQPEKAQRMLEIAVNNTDRLVRLINDILDLDRIQSGKAILEKRICNAADLMLQAADTMRAMAEKANITLCVEPINVQVWADPDRIIQTLTNLLSNAIKFSDAGSTVWLSGKVWKVTESDERLSIPIRSGTPADTTLKTQSLLLIAVRDRGRGIPADKLESIFERFQQVDSSDARLHGGTGLGLSICRSIVQQHGGQIWAESIPGEGSTFYFTLPQVKQEVENSTELVHPKTGTRQEVEQNCDS